MLYTDEHCPTQRPSTTSPISQKQTFVCGRRGLLPVRRHLSISFAAGAAAATAEAVMVRIRCAGHVCCSAAIRPNGVGAGRPCLLRVEVQASAVGSNSSGFFFFALSVLFWILIFVVLLLL